MSFGLPKQIAVWLAIFSVTVILAGLISTIIEVPDAPEGDTLCLGVLH